MRVVADKVEQVAVGSASGVCFVLSRPANALPVPFVTAPRLDELTAQALADVLPLLSCGEEAATIAFHRLADQAGSDTETTMALRRIEMEEHVHESLLQQLAVMLPPSKDAAELRRAARRFHIHLAAQGRALHLARIAAIDAAACTVLSRLISSRAALAHDEVIVQLFQRIRHDEARHVAVARTLVRALGTGDRMHHAAAAARLSLADLLRLRGAAFEGLRIDPDALIRHVARLPNGLL
jgi:hypothetical protein